MSSISSLSQGFNSISSSGSLVSEESWQDIRELPETPQASNSPGPSNPKRSPLQVRGDRLNDIDGVNCSLSEGDASTRPEQHPESDARPTCMIQHLGINNLISFSDGNIDLVVGDNSFRLHEYKLKEFIVLKDVIEAGRRTSYAETNTAPLRITLEEKVDDVCNMLSILYSPVYAGETQKPSVEVLKSTLRLATKFQHPNLRTFAIRGLENENLAPIERVIISRQSNVPSWMPHALDELCLREAPISYAEAVALGTKTFVEIAARREVYKSMAGHGLIAFKNALRSKTYDDPNSADVRSGCSRVVDSEPVMGHNTALDHIITTAFSVVSSETRSDNGL